MKWKESEEEILFTWSSIFITLRNSYTPEQWLTVEKIYSENKIEINAFQYHNKLNCFSMPQIWNQFLFNWLAVKMASLVVQQ